MLAADKPCQYLGPAQATYLQRVYTLQWIADKAGDELEGLNLFGAGGRAVGTLQKWAILKRND